MLSKRACGRRRTVIPLIPRITSLDVATMGDRLAAARARLGGGASLRLSFYLVRLRALLNNRGNNPPARRSRHALNANSEGLPMAPSTSSLANKVTRRE